MDAIRKNFGSVTCEIFVHRTRDTGGGTFVARALQVCGDGRADPLYDEVGRLYCESASTERQAVLTLCTRLVKRFGAEKDSA
jgi:hypothetical protein